MRGSAGIVNALVGEGVGFVAGIIGGSTHEIVDSLHDAPQIRSILTRHERVAVDIADGYARVSNRIGVAMCVQGPGGANAVAGIANSFADSSPVVLLHGQVRQEQYGRGASQEMAVAELFRPITKWVATITKPQRIPELMRRAFTVANSGRPGPVVVEIPNDVSAADVEPDKLAYVPVGRRYRCAADPEDVDRAAALLLAARRPILYTGAGVLKSDATPELVELAELLAAPTMSTLNGKSGFPEDHPLALGLGGYPQSLYSTGPAIAFAHQADVVFSIGCGFKAYATNQFARLPEGARLIQADADVREIGKNYPVEVGLVGDAKLVLRQMVNAVRDRLDGARRDASLVAAEIARLRQEWMAEWLPLLTSDEVPINPYRVTWELMQNLDPRRSIVLHDSGAGRGYTSHHYMAPVPHSFVGFGGQSTMGWSLGASMGAKIARPDMTVVDVIGDGSFGMTGMDVETAVRCGIPVLVLIANNGGLDLSKQSQRKGFRPYDEWISLTGDYVAMARAMGANAERVEDPRELGPALKRGVQSTLDGRPAVLEVLTKSMEPGPTKLR